MMPMRVLMRVLMRVAMRMVLRWVVLLMSLMAVPAYADGLRPGYLEFTQRDASQWQLVWKAPLRSGVTADTQPILPEVCRIVTAAPPVFSNSAVTLRADVECHSNIAGARIGLSNLQSAQTDILVRVAPLNRSVQLFRLTASTPIVEITPRPDRFQVAQSYFVLGVEHILEGFDHLLFVIALVLLLSGFWMIAKAVTAFTLAHSMTLIATTLGLVGLPQAPVEAVIALSIIFLAVEVAKKRSAKLRFSQRAPWVVAFLFGLLHGFGFAGALREIGLPESDVPTALLTFNLGVEAGQLMIVTATVAVVAIMRRIAPAWLPLVLRLSIYAIGTAASYWFIDRLIG